MIYRCPDGATFSSYQAMCDHMVHLAKMQGNYDLAEYYRKEKEKMNRKQEKEFPVFAAIFIGGFVLFLIMAITGNL